VLLLQAGTIANDDDLDHKLFEEMPGRQPQAGEPCHNLSFLFCTGDICPALRRCRSISQVTVVPVLCCRHFCVKAIVLGFYVEVTDATHCSIYLGDSII
jgi:hypothetical protein